jgi:hypothetical protein
VCMGWFPTATKPITSSTRSLSFPDAHIMANCHAQAAELTCTPLQMLMLMQATYTFSLPYVYAVQTTGLSFPVHIWYDSEGKRLRTDVYGGLDTTMTVEVCGRCSSSSGSFYSARFRA